MRGYVALAAGVACVAFASAASATDFSVPAPINPDRFYVSFHGGYTFGNVSHDVAYDTNPLYPYPNPVGPTVVSDGISKPGWRVGAAVGRDVGKYLSLEAEVAYAAASIDHVHIIAIQGTPYNVDQTATGSGSTLTGMINVFAGLPVGPIRPYVGAGAGVAYFTANDIRSPVPPPTPPLQQAVLNGSDIGLAAQLIAGIDFAINDNTSIGGRYRFLHVTDLSLMDGGYKHDFSLNSQSVEVVLTQKFN